MLLPPPIPSLELVRASERARLSSSSHRLVFGDFPRRLPVRKVLLRATERPNDDDDGHQLSKRPSAPLGLHQRALCPVRANNSGQRVCGRRAKVAPALRGAAGRGGDTRPESGAPSSSGSGATRVCSASKQARGRGRSGALKLQPAPDSSHRKCGERRGFAALLLGQSPLMQSPEPAPFLRRRDLALPHCCETRRDRPAEANNVLQICARQKMRRVLKFNLQNFQYPSA